jgi:hemerythrin
MFKILLRSGPIPSGEDICPKSDSYYTLYNGYCQEEWLIVNHLDDNPMCNYIKQHIKNWDEKINKWVSGMSTSFFARFGDDSTYIALDIYNFIVNSNIPFNVYGSKYTFPNYNNNETYINFIDEINANDDINYVSKEHNMTCLEYMITDKTHVYMARREYIRKLISYGALNGHEVMYFKIAINAVNNTDNDDEYSTINIIFNELFKNRHAFDENNVKSIMNVNLIKHFNNYTHIFNILKPCINWNYPYFENGDTILMQAIQHHQDSAQFILRHVKNIDVNCQNDYGHTALMYLCRPGAPGTVEDKVTITQLLIHKGANVNMEDELGNSAINMTHGIIAYKQTEDSDMKSIRELLISK